ncbi:NAD kinase [Granulicatella seriolae]|uniref:NAD kinase n=1 Tax=Granulicatella seriolae TaxID=2967226 RepID=A0ABT1WKQ9_9LACT|nr:NAD kinase [Granulicatella seriolae]
MRVALVYNHSDKSLEVVQEFLKLCQDGQFIRDDKNPEVVVTIGGDGTLLGAVHKYGDQLDKVRFAGIHTGHLGFYTDWRDYEAAELIESLKKDQSESVSYPLLDVTITKNDGQVCNYFALNEATIRKVNGTLFCEVIINNELFENFRGDGLCISTPTGSTGLNKSLGGAIVHPFSEVIQLTEMASINNRVYRTLSSPMILAKKDVLLLKPHSHDGMMVSIDHLNYEADSFETVQLKVSQKRVSFVRYRHNHFWDRVEEAFIGARVVSKPCQ